MIAIVNYGLGNVQAIANIYHRLGVQSVLATSAAQIEAAERVVLPGVGAFDRAMGQLDASGMRAALETAVVRQSKPVLGICVGMQMLAERSDEGQAAGLGWVKGEVKKFDVSQFHQQTHLPHMGWNDVAPVGADPLFRDLCTGSRFYFLHSFYFSPSREDDVIARADYNGAFACAVRSGNVFGVQFHPEKSHQWGIQLLRNFAEAT
jgi:glutamine amidotransferase